MKISINTSSFSFQFTGIWLAVISIVFFFICEILAISIFLLAISLYFQKHKYFIPKKANIVSGKVERTLTKLGLKYKKITNGFSTQKVDIKTLNFLFFTVIYFKFPKMYNTQGKYLAESITKYQRYP